MLLLARRELEKLQDENRTMLERSLEVEDMFQVQTTSCMKVLGEVLRLVWSLSNRSVLSFKVEEYEE